MAESIRIDALQYSNWNRERFEEWRQGDLTAVHVTCAIWEDARASLSEIARWHRRLIEHEDLLMLTVGGDDILEAKRRGKTGVILGFQNSSPLEDDLDLVWVFQQLGIRLIQLTYNTKNLVGSGCWEERDTGLGLFGKGVIKEMNAAGVLVDLSHCGEQTCLDAIASSHRPVMITHANPKEYVGGAVELAQRNKSTEVMRAVVESGGVIGLSMYPRIAPDGPACTLERFCDMVAWTAERVGASNVALGSDFCIGHPQEAFRWWRAGRWSREPAIPLSGAVKFPDWIATPARFGNLAEGLRKQGFSPDEVDGIMGGNWLRAFTDGFKPRP